MDSDLNSDVSFSHVQLYVDKLEDLSSLKQLEHRVNKFHDICQGDISTNLEKCTEAWLCTGGDAAHEMMRSEFQPAGRDVVKQLIVGFGFRVIGFYEDSKTRSFLLSSKDLSGVKFVATSTNTQGTKMPGDKTHATHYRHFDAGRTVNFFSSHCNRQGFGVMGFYVSNIELVYAKYKKLHPNLILDFTEYDTGEKILEVFAYYKPSHHIDDGKKVADQGTLLRFVDRISTSCVMVLPGFTSVDAIFSDNDQPAYCDHWVSNVFNREEFLEILEATLGFTPKVDFNAGVVAAGEAQIESTVIGNDSASLVSSASDALKDQSQVYLPINNALSEVGHVHSFLEEMGQGIQHVASRVDNIVAFVRRCNQMRAITGEGFSFLSIPRSYYGVLDADYLVTTASVSLKMANSIVQACEQRGIVESEGAVSMVVSKEEMASSLGKFYEGNTMQQEYCQQRDCIVGTLMKSRYRNLFELLGDQVSEETYFGIVENQILVDVQGGDVLCQIFTGNVMQRESGDEAPFFEFIQRVCAPCRAKVSCPAQIKPGCGGFGIRNFLTLFLSIEVSKAVLECERAKLRGDETVRQQCQEKVACFTEQLTAANPILNEISAAMTEEGIINQKRKDAEKLGDLEQMEMWRMELIEAGQRKAKANIELLQCSSYYQKQMQLISARTKSVGSCCSP